MQTKDSIVAREAMMTSIINHFGEVAPMVEHNVFSWMNFLSEDYDGGMWDYHELSNGGFYMTPPAGMYKVHQKGNMFCEVISAQLSGIIATYFSLYSLSLRDYEDAELYYKYICLLNEYIDQLDPKSRKLVLSALD